MSTMRIPLQPFSTGLAEHIINITGERDQKLSDLNKLRRANNVGEEAFTKSCESVYDAWEEGVQRACRDVMATAEKSLGMMVNLHKAIGETNARFAAAYPQKDAVDVPEMPE